MKLLIICILSMLATPALVGCASINAASSTAGVVENSTIQFATAEFISKAGDAAAQLARAQKVKAIAIEIQGIDSGTVTIAQLAATVSADIGKLPIPDQILANALVQAIVANLGIQVNTGVLNAALTAEINVVMKDIQAACALYGA
jgi:hypothetical protein